jgi:hypothetical protein
MKKLNLFLILILFGFGMVVQTAHSQVTSAPNLLATTGPSHNARLAIAPYAQVVPNNSYTFIGVTHPSLATAHTSIGLVIEAMDMSFTPRGASTTEELRAVVFTINAGETHRVFIVNEGHSTIKSSNTVFTSANNTHLITTTDDAQFGNIRVTSIGAHPNERTHDAKRDGPYSTLACATTSVTASCIQRFDNLNQLSMWGVVYQEANGAGFSLEFIGDMHDSSASGVQPYSGGNLGVANHTTRMHNHSAHGIADGTVSAGAGRGIN